MLRLWELEYVKDKREMNNENSCDIVERQDLN